ncbi:hypothetical protein VNO78_34334 [Psophocarpus tetragonolobus]|uniref:FHA domain-containing protein n=1 Tax=Psophocarpus tetragonolobus TaxID=3891 RepID=A0AAN9NVC6_PSOTE
MASTIGMQEKSNSNSNKNNLEKEEQAKFPVLTVLKNQAILKNIFMLLDHKNEDQTVLIGRHPHCNIVLTHPSVSRFHLRIRFNPSSPTLSLLDLSSAHGTWVCGRKLQPGVSVELKEGDTFTVGLSTRLYRLSWLPLTQLDVFVPQQQQKHDQQPNIIKDENLDIIAEQEIPMSEDIVSLCCEERKNHSEDEALGVLDETEASRFLTKSGSKNIIGECQNHVLSPPHIQSPPYAPPVNELDNIEKIEACAEAVMPEENNLFCTLKEYLTHNICLPVVEVVQGAKIQQFQPQDDTFTGQPPSTEMHWSSLTANIVPWSFDEKDVAAVAVIPTESEFGCTHRDNDKAEGLLTTGPRTCNSENTCLIVNEDIPYSEFHQIEILDEVSVDSVSEPEKQHEMQWSSLPINIDPTSFDEKDVAVVAVIPTESEFGCTHRHNEKVEGILTTSPRAFNSENMCLIFEDIPDSKFHQMEVGEEVPVEDSVPNGEKQDECKKECKFLDLNAKSCCEEGYSLDEIVEDNENKCFKNLKPVSFDEEGLAPVALIPTESEFGCMLGDNERIEDILEIESRTINYENTSLQDEEAIPVNRFQLVNTVEEVAMDFISDVDKEDKCSKRLDSKLPASHCAESCQEQGNSVAEVAEDTGEECARSVSSKSFRVEPPNSHMLQEAVLNITIENQTPQSLIAETGCSGGEFLENCEKPVEKSSTFGSIWSRRDKAASAPQNRARKSKFMSTCKKIGTEGKKSNMKDVINKSMPKDLSSVFDKENLSPYTYHLQFMRKKGKVEEIKHSMSQRLLHLSYSAKSISAVSNKVNQTPKVGRECKSQRQPLECRINLVPEQEMKKLKKNKVEKLPIQSVTKTGNNHKSVTISAAKSIDDAPICGPISNKCTKPSLHISGEQKRRWDMVVDTASLLNNESRKALQLLQVLLFFSQVKYSLMSVIRELGSMKQQYRIFRTTSEASLALEWIEECMEKTSWWIHIQSSKEECRQTAPASPQTRFIEESWAFHSSMISNKCASPTVEDHILDCALQCRGKENVGQLVLLSDDVTTKVKSMERGLLCETVQQFRHSLVNPFSERFMWPKSSPRGLTWSCKDDLVLREKYCGLPPKIGLKLITDHFLYLQ